MLPHSTKIEVLAESMSTDLEKGLTNGQAEEFYQKYGANKLSEKKKTTVLERFLEQFKDVMIIILLAAALISFIVAFHEKNLSEFFEPALILIIVIANAVLGVMQESKAEKALEALKSMSAPNARVIRDGAQKIIPSSELVPGDIIKLEAGDFIPADARIFKLAGLKCEESALTGESVPSEKELNKSIPENAPLGDRDNMVFSGCSVSYGTAAAVVTATGMNTEMGKIAHLLDNENEGQTPLQKKLADLGKWLGIIALAACALVFILGIIDNMPILEIFMTSVSLAVSAIPEGLPAIVTITLSIGVQRMVKKNAIIRRLPAVETLGSASVICSDKTGTLTQNRMTLQKVYVDGQDGAETVTRNNSIDAKNLLKYAVLCCDGEVAYKDGVEKHIGDPTETAIVAAAHKNGLVKSDLNAGNPRLSEIPFDSDRKLMTTINKIDGKYIVIVKGAFDVMAKECVSGDIEKAREMVDRLSADALRVLAVGIKEIDGAPVNPKPEELETGLTFIGLVGMIDPPRPEAKDAVAVCRAAGITPVMITGDHVITASAIAKELGILNVGGKSVTGGEIDKMSDGELDEQVRDISVYARVSPENKIRIVKAWQKKGEIVSMTGDGVNDAPALKAADIGCAMGITGTDVAKGAADMTLTDDNFATIVEAVKEGRGIYANIKKVVGYLLGTNIGEVLTVLFAMLIWREAPLVSMQLLWINLVTDGMPAVALGTEAVEDGVMNDKPKPKNESVFAGGMGLRVVIQGVMFAALTLIGFYLGKRLGGTLVAGQTMAFAVLSTTQIVQAYNMRSERSLFKIGFFTNKNLNWAALTSIIMIGIVLFTPLYIIFGLTTLAPVMYVYALGLAAVPFFVMETVKAIHNS